MKQYIITISLVISFSAAVYAQQMSNEKTFLITERLTIEALPEGKNDLSVWIPLPSDDIYQNISSLEIKTDRTCNFTPLEKTTDFKQWSSFKADSVKNFFSNWIKEPRSLTGFTSDKTYNNKILYIKPNSSNKKNTTIQIFFTVKRKEILFKDIPSPAELLPAKHYLKSEGRVTVNKEIRTLAAEITGNKKTDLEKVRSIYDYLINNLTYSKDDPDICGIGDSLITLKHKKGICSDYHSLFISLVRSIGIPAKFEIGLGIPNDKEEGVIEGYHCWAKFYLKDKGWIPVDISEADKHPELRDYYFGNLDADRVLLTVGRDIILNPRQSEEPLNFFVFPYAELNKKEFKNIRKEVDFKIISSENLKKLTKQF